MTREDAMAKVREGGWTDWPDKAYDEEGLYREFVQLVEAYFETKDRESFVNIDLKCDDASNSRKITNFMMPHHHVWVEQFFYNYGTEFEVAESQMKEHGHYHGLTPGVYERCFMQFTQMFAASRDESRKLLSELYDTFVH